MLERVARAVCEVLDSVGHACCARCDLGDEAIDDRAFLFPSVDLFEVVGEFTDVSDECVECDTDRYGCRDGWTDEQCDA